MKNQTLKLVVVLALISIGSGFFLALTYAYTIPHIEGNAARDKEIAILETLPEAEDYEELEGIGFPMYKGLDTDGKAVGFAYVAEGGGFQGLISLMVGVDPEHERITKVKLLSHSETPGLGARIGEGAFLHQFMDKQICDDFEMKKDCDSVTGATVSSKAVATILKKTLPQALEQYRESGGGNQ